MSALQGLVDSINARMRQMMELQHQSHQDTLNRQAMAHQNLMERLSQPKQVIRDANGRIVGVK
jgi:uncharacterized protein YdbL (DUF1318 family)